MDDTRHESLPIVESDSTGGSAASAPPLDNGTKMEDANGNFDVFVSYATKDQAFSDLLAARLRTFKPPRGLGLPNRALTTFRYQTDFKGVAYEKAIRDLLRRSKSLIVVCSPDAVASSFVNDEIIEFVASDPRTRSDRVIPILYRGLPNNEVTREQEGLKAFPPALVDLFGIPIAANYLGFDVAHDKPDKGIYANGWYTVLANVYDVSRAAIEDRHRRQRPPSAAGRSGPHRQSSPCC